MSRRLVALFALGVALGGGAVVLWRVVRHAAPRAAVPAARAPEPAPRATQAPAEPAAEADSAPAPPAVGPLRERRYSTEHESEEQLARLPTRIDYPLLPKYRGAVWSDVPHHLVAAWDESPEAEAPGRRRVAIVTVAPSLSDADVTRLLRDLQDRHRDAEQLLVRVFDDEQAARQPSWTDGGELRRDHLVGELRRSARTGRDRISVRGRPVTR